MDTFDGTCCICEAPTNENDGIMCRRCGHCVCSEHNDGDEEHFCDCLNCTHGSSTKPYSTARYAVCDGCGKRIEI